MAAVWCLKTVLITEKADAGCGRIAVGFMIHYEHSTRPYNKGITTSVNLVSVTHDGLYVCSRGFDMLEPEMIMNGRCTLIVSKISWVF